MGRPASDADGRLATRCAIRKEDAGRMGSGKSMETTPAFARPFARPPVALSWACGLGLLAFAFYAAIALLHPIIAALTGAGGLVFLRWARAERPFSQALILIDLVAFVLFAYDRNDSLGFWQLPGP